MKQNSDRTKLILSIVGLVIILIIIIPILVGIGASLFSLSKSYTAEPNPLNISEAENWQAYIDEQNGFSIQYPPELYVSEKPFEGFAVTFQITDLKELALSPDVAPRIQIFVSDMPVSELLKKVNDNRNKEQFGEFQKIDINGYEAYQTTALDEKVIFTDTIVGNDNKSYLIELFTTEQENPALRQAYEKMLKSFKIDK